MLPSAAPMSFGEGLVTCREPPVSSAAAGASSQLYPSRRAKWFLLVAVTGVAATTVTGAQSGEDRQVANVAAFARLSGVVRYFCPSDAAATPDWDRFAVYGVSRVRTARPGGALQASLRERFSPLGPTLQVSASRQSAPQVRPDPRVNVRWQYLGVPFGWPVPRGAFTMKRIHRPYKRERPSLDRLFPPVASAAEIFG